MSLPRYNLETTSVGTSIEHDWFLALVQYGDVARVKYDVSVCGCRHASLDRESFTVRGGDHDLIDLLRGEMGIVQRMYEEKDMMKFLFPESGTVFVRLLGARTCCDFFLPGERLTSASQ